ncbi:MAG: hypothetical protein ACI91B_003454 [Planctomycetota bacterium]|jgi:hypothetical protein
MGFLALPFIVAAARMVRHLRGSLVLAVLTPATVGMIFVQKPIVMQVLITMQSYGTDSAEPFVSPVLPAVWHIYLGYAIALAAMVWIGFALGHKTARRVANDWKDASFEARSHTAFRRLRSGLLVRTAKADSQ